jgi:transcriptional regulator with XRE-family HTH domain
MSDRDEHEVIGSRLREAREFVGLLQDEAASALGIPRTSLSALEAGKRKVSGVELRRLARLYRRPVDWLLGEDDTPVDESDPLFRATSQLSDQDKEQVLRFAEFLAAAGRPGADNRAAAGKSTPRKRAPKT